MAQNKTPEKKVAENKPKNLRYLRDKYQEKVKGIFKNYELPGGSLSFNFREFKEDKIEKYLLQDGKVYTLPLGVAKHLNKNCWYPVHAHRKDDSGNSHQMIGKKVRRFGFQSLEFMDPEDLGDAPSFAPVEPDLQVL